MKPKNIIATAVAAIPTVNKFAPSRQMREIIAGTQGDERQKYLEILSDFGERIVRMPVSGEEVIPKEDEIAQLHYKSGLYNWYVTRKGPETPTENALVLITAPGIPESIGFMSVKDIINLGAELNLSFKPQRLSKIPRIGMKKPARKVKARKSND